MNNNSKNSQTTLGLDFGTAYSFPACKVPDSDPEILLTLEKFAVCDKGIPSLFWSDRNGNVRVGSNAAIRNAEWNDAKGVVRSIKTKLHEKEFRLYQKTYTPKEIVKKIMENIFQLAQEKIEEDDILLPEEKRIVMGVPVNFGDYERNLLRSAVKELGYSVELLPEPMAAATYYAYKNPNKFNKVLVFDMGAGTFDVAFLEKNDSPSYEEPYPYRCPKKGFDGNMKAGDVIDEYLTEYIRDRFEPKPSKELAEALRDKNTVEYRQLLLVAKKIKEIMSNKSIHTENFSLGAQNGFFVTVTREELEKVAAPVVNEAVDMCWKIIKNCHMENQDFSIIMVGGMSNLEMIREALAHRFPVQAKENKIQKKNPTRAVALGCAIYAEQPVLSRRVTFGYAVASYYNNKSVLSVEIPADVKLPYVVESHYATRHNNQTEVEFRIYEVEDAKEGEHLPIERGNSGNYLTVIHPFGQSVPMGTEVTFRIELTESGILNVSVEDDGISKKTVRDFSIGIENLDIVRGRNGG